MGLGSYDEQEQNRRNSKTGQVDMGEGTRDDYEGNIEHDHGVDETGDVVEQMIGHSQKLSERLE